jgi:hypothetical protein
MLARASGLATVSLLFLTAGASGLAAGSYKGTTGQKQTITFKVAGGAVTKLDFFIRDKCPDGHLLHVHDHGFPAMTITHGKFGGTFGPSGQPTVVKGTVSGKKVTGTLKDDTVSPKTQALCRGHTTFTAHHA